MPRPRQSRALSVWMNGERVGLWETPARGGHVFVYADSWLGSPHARPISLSLPLRPSNEPFRDGVGSFFDNLLPDNRAIRERIQRRFRTPGTDAFDLLRAVGRDCVGALQLLPEDAAPGKVSAITGERLSPARVAALLSRSLADRSPSDAAGDDHFRIIVWPEPRRKPPCSGTTERGIARPGPRRQRTSSSSRSEPDRKA